MKKIEEQLESIEEVLTHLVKKVSGIEESTTKVKTDDDTRKKLTDIEGALIKMPSSRQLDAQMRSIQTGIENLPKQSQVKHHHHFDVLSKGFIISVLALLLITGICIAFAIGYHNENSRLEANDVKYRMIRQVNPAIAVWADSVYYQNPDLALKETIRREDFDLVLKDAEADLTRKRQEAERAGELLKELKRK